MGSNSNVETFLYNAFTFSSGGGIFSNDILVIVFYYVCLQLSVILSNDILVAGCFAVLSLKLRISSSILFQVLSRICDFLVVVHVVVCSVVLFATHL